MTSDPGALISCDLEAIFGVMMIYTDGELHEF